MLEIITKPLIGCIQCKICIPSTACFFLQRESVTGYWPTGGWLMRCFISVLHYAQI